MLRGTALFVLLFAIWTSLNYCVMSEETIVGYGRHTMVNNKITQLGSAKRIANNNEDLQDYKGTENACDVKFDENGDIVLNYNTVRENGCAIDLLKRISNWYLEFNASLSNDNKEIKECLQPMPNGLNANLVPFAYSIGLEHFEKLKEGPYEENISCDKDACLNSGGECLKPQGLEFGWGYNKDKVHVSMQPSESKILSPKLFLYFTVGEPNVCGCPHKKDRVNNLKSVINVHVDDHISWFRVEKVERNCYVSFSSCKPLCINNDEDLIEEGLIKPITWKIEDKSHVGSYYDELLAFYLLPQKASFQRDGKNIKRNVPLNGPNCKIEIKFSGQDYKLLINEKEEPSTEPSTLSTIKPWWKKSTTSHDFNIITTTTKSRNWKYFWLRPTKKSNRDKYITFALVVVNIILLVSLVSVLCWCCFCREEKK